MWIQLCENKNTNNRHTYIYKNFIFFSNIKILINFLYFNIPYLYLILLFYNLLERIRELPNNTIIYSSMFPCIIFYSILFLFLFSIVFHFFYISFFFYLLYSHVSHFPARSLTFFLHKSNFPIVFRQLCAVECAMWRRKYSFSCSFRAKDCVLV